MCFNVLTLSDLSEVYTDLGVSVSTLPLDPVLLHWDKLKIEVILGYKKGLRTVLGVMITSRKPQLTFLGDFFLRARRNFASD